MTRADVDRERVARALRASASASAPSSDFDLNPGDAPPPDRPLRAAGVLIAIWPRPGGLVLVLTRRSAALRHHPGQIALPGGKVEVSDGGPVGAALREAAEEVALPEGAVEVAGTLPPHRTVTGFAVTPVVGWIARDFVPRAEPGEVAEVFTVPFAHVADPGAYAVRSRQWRGTERRFYAVPWGPYYIWGATARILYGLAQRVAP